MKNTKIGIRTEVRDRLAKFVTKKGQTWNDIIIALMDHADWTNFQLDDINKAEK